MLCNDNQNAQKLTWKRQQCFDKTKHIDIKYHFVRETLERNQITLKYVSTDKMIADMLTKFLNRLKHNFFLKGFILRNNLY